MSLPTLDLTDAKERLDRDGYLVVEDVFDAEADFKQMYEDWQEVLDGMAEEYIAKGTLSSSYEGLSFNDRLLKIVAETDANFPDIALPQNNVKPDTPIYLGSGVFSVLTNPRLLDVIESILGGEITSNPIQHVRMIRPTALISERTERGRPSPFHQDMGVSMPEADESEILTVWISVTGSSEELSCMQIYPHTAHGELIHHCPNGSPALKGMSGRGIPPKLMPAGPPTPVPVRPGGVLMFKGRLVHGSFANHTHDRVRISLDTRYQISGRPTGRPGFPEFVARSRKDPSSEIHDPKAWAEMWYQARERLAETGTPQYYRWNSEAPECA